MLIQILNVNSALTKSFNKIFLFLVDILQQKRISLSIIYHQNLQHWISVIKNKIITLMNVLKQRMGQKVSF